MFTFAATPKNAARLVSLAKRFDMSVSHDVIALAANYEPTKIEGFKFVLLQFQDEDLPLIEAADGNVLLAYEQGLGKTVMFTAYVWKNRERKFPCLMVVPNSLKLNWRNEVFAMLGNQVRVNVIGKKYGKAKRAMLAEKYPNMVFSEAPVTGCEFYIINYDILGKHARVLEKMGFKQLGADESHKTKTEDAIRTRALMRLKQGYVDVKWQEIEKKFKVSRDGLIDITKLQKEIQDWYGCEIDINSLTAFLAGPRKPYDPIRLIYSKGIKSYMPMSGTPLLNRARELWTTVHLLAPHVDGFDEEYKFLYRYCDPQKVWNGKKNITTFNGCTNEERLNAELNKIMIRRLKADVLADLPEKRWVRVALDFDRTDYDRLAAQFEKEFGDYDEVAELFHKHGGNPPANLMGPKVVAFMKLREMATLAKLDAAIEWICDFSETDKLLVFCEHRSVVEKIAAAVRDHFGYDDAAKIIYGGMDTDVTDDGKRMFNTEQRCRVMILNHEAGGVGHTLHANGACSNVAFVEFPWTAALAQQDADRIHRIGQINAVTAWGLFAEDTVEDRAAALISKKGCDSDRVIDGGRKVNEIVWNNSYDLPMAA